MSVFFVYRDDASNLANAESVLESAARRRGLKIHRNRTCAYASQDGTARGCDHVDSENDRVANGACDEIQNGIRPLFGDEMQLSSGTRYYIVAMGNLSQF